MIKDFDVWNQKKKRMDGKESQLFFKEGEIWWISFGINIGYEINGKGEDFIRPAVILKKYNRYSFLALPLSTSNKINIYRVPIGIVDGKDAIANLSQIRNLDSRRLRDKIGHLEVCVLKELKEKTSQINFS